MTCSRVGRRFVRLHSSQSAQADPILEAFGGLVPPFTLRGVNMKTGFYNVEFAMPGNFGSGSILINEPELLCDPLAEFERSQQDDGKLFIESCMETTNAESLMSQFGIHHAIVCVAPAPMGQGLEVHVSCDDGLSFRLRVQLVDD